MDGRGSMTLPGDTDIIEFTVRARHDEQGWTGEVVLPLANGREFVPFRMTGGFSPQDAIENVLRSAPMILEQLR